MSELAQLNSDITKLPALDLRRELTGLMADTAARLLRIAQIVAELDRRGEDLSDLRIGDLARMRLIAGGQLLPELALKYSGRPALVRALANIPMADQRRLAETGSVEVFVGNQSKTIRLEHLPTPTVQQVFASDHIRPLNEQAEYVGLKRMRGRKSASEEETPRKFRPRPDHQRGGLWIGKMFVPREELIAALSELSGKLIDIDADDSTTATVRITEQEKAKLRAAEKRRKLPEWHIIREALQAVGLI